MSEDEEKHCNNCNHDWKFYEDYPCYECNRKTKLRDCWERKEERRKMTSIDEKISDQQDIIRNYKELIQMYERRIGHANALITFYMKQKNVENKNKD